jgi:hypothetical protein
VLVVVARLEMKHAPQDSLVSPRRRFERTVGVGAFPRRVRCHGSGKRWSSGARLALPKIGEATVSIERIGPRGFRRAECDVPARLAQSTEQGKSILSAAESRLDMWLLTMNSDLGDREVRELVNTMRAVRERIARARDYA